VRAFFCTSDIEEGYETTDRGGEIWELRDGLDSDKLGWTECPGSWNVDSSHVEGDKGCAGVAD